MFQAFALDTMKIWQTNKQKAIVRTYKEFLETCIKYKKNIMYIVCFSK